MLNTLSLLLETTAAEPGLTSQLSTLIPLILVIPVFYFIMIRPQKKKDKEAQLLRDEIMVGDEIVTVGGVVGRVVSCKKDQETILIESGNDRTKLRMLKSAIQVNHSATERLAAAKAAAKAEQKDKKGSVDETKPTVVDETKD